MLNSEIKNAIHLSPYHEDGDDLSFPLTVGQPVYVTLLDGRIERFDMNEGGEITVTPLEDYEDTYNEKFPKVSDDYQIQVYRALLTRDLRAMRVVIPLRGMHSAERELLLDIDDMKELFRVRNQNRSALRQWSDAIQYRNPRKLFTQRPAEDLVFDGEIEIHRGENNILNLSIHSVGSAMLVLENGRMAATIGAISRSIHKKVDSVLLRSVELKDQDSWCDVELDDDGIVYVALFDETILERITTASPLHEGENMVGGTKVFMRKEDGRMLLRFQCVEEARRIMVDRKNFSSATLLKGDPFAMDTFHPDANAHLRNYACCAGCDGEISFPEQGMFGKTVRAGRLTNEDGAYVFPGDQKKHIPETIAVGDGLGGYEVGEIASAVVIQSLHEHIADPQTKRLWGVELTTKICRDLDAALQKKGIRSSYGSQPGSTLSVVQKDMKDGNPVLRGFYVGDSPIFIIDITMQERLECYFGSIVRQETFISPMEGAGRAAKTFEKSFDPSHKILTLVCSDGVASDRVLGSKEILEIALRDPEHAAANLIEAAIKKGTKDNATVCQMFSGAWSR